MPRPFDPYHDADPPHDPRRSLGACDCHLRNASRLTPGECGSETPDPRCPKCHGEGEIFARTEAA